jgi:peptidoglycan hydrolase-like protein with peptidoglycan-binding domain
VTATDERRSAPSATDGEHDQDDPETDLPAEPRRHRLLGWLGLGGAVVTAAGAGIWLWSTGSSSGTASASATPGATATVERGTLAATESWEGTLDYGTPFTVTSNGEGIVTWLVDEAEVLERGDLLYRVNERPVTLLYGDVPMYRDLRPGDTGTDVAQLKANLAELGYDGFDDDDEFSPSVADAVRAWQEDVGVEPTGTVGRGDVVFAAEGGQVDGLRSGVGEMVTPGRAVMDITGAEQVVSFEVELDDRDRVEVGTEVTVELPDSDELTGTVAVTTVAEVAAAESDDPMGGGETESIAQVEVTVDDDVPADLSDEPVDVVVVTDERDDVLSVPVNALVALAEGGYGLEVVADDGDTSTVPVETGLFAQGKVEIDSDGVAEGTVVGTAGR